METDTQATPQQLAAIAAAAQMRAVDLRWLAAQVERLTVWHTPGTPGVAVLKRAADTLRQLAGGTYE